MVMTHDSLVRFDEKMNPVPQLARRFASDESAGVWTFELTPDAKWHDGRPVTADDVVFTFQYMARNHGPGAWVGDLIEKIEARGNCVIFRLKKPYSRFLINAGFVVRILPRHIWKNISDPRRTRDPAVTVGCGPYRFAGFDRSAGTIRFHVNADYHGFVPQAARVDFCTYGTMDLLALALIKGRVDLYYQYASGMPVPYVDKLKAEPGLDCMEAASMGIPAVLGFNLSRPLVKSIKVRRAVALAVDYAHMNSCLMKGKGRIPSPGLTPPSFPVHMDMAPWAKDLEQSRSLLESEGWVDLNGDGLLNTPHGETVQLTLLVRSDLWGEAQMVKLLAHDFKRVGLGLKVRSADLSTYLAFLKEGDYDLVLFRTTPWGMMMHAGYGSGYFDAKTSGHLNMCRLKDPEFSTLCDGILNTRNPRTLKTLYTELQQYYAEHLPAVALCWGRSFFPHARKWQGFQINPLEGGLANRFSWRNLKPLKLNQRDVGD
jgi:peptide/nickel transport system substrate-binding protein